MTVTWSDRKSVMTRAVSLYEDRGRYPHLDMLKLGGRLKCSIGNEQRYYDDDIAPCEPLSLCDVVRMLTLCIQAGGKGTGIPSESERKTRCESKLVSGQWHSLGKSKVDSCPVLILCPSGCWDMKSRNDPGGSALVVRGGRQLCPVIGVPGLGGSSWQGSWR